MGRLTGGILADCLGAYLPLPLPTLTDHSRPDQHHVTCGAYRGRADLRMAIHTRDSRTLFARGVLRRIVRSNDGSHGRAYDGARRER